MGVLFNQIPGNLRVPLFYAEVNAGQSPFQGHSRTLVIGQKTASGSAPADNPQRLSGDPTALGGVGSQLTDMLVWARQNHPLGEIWFVPLADPAGAAATFTITTSGFPVAAPGTLVLYICGERIQVAVSTADTNATVATAIAAAINAGYVKFGRGLSFPVSAAAAAAVVTCTSRNVGALGSKIAIDKDRVGDEGPLAANVAIAAGTAGTGVPTLATALANLGDQEFDWIVAPYADTTSLNALKDFLGSQAGRWSPLKQLYGHYVTCLFDTFSNLAGVGAARNDENATIMGVVNSPSPPWRWAAAVGALIGRYKNLGTEVSQAYELSRPLHTLPLVGILPPKARGDWFDITERQQLYNDGISGFTVDVDGTVRLDRVITTYQSNASGQPDITWLDVETRAQMVYIVRYLRQRLTQEYGRHALASDNPGNNPAVATPKRLKATVVAAYRELEEGGVTEKTDLFAQRVVVDRSADPNRVDMYLPVDVVNQLRVIAANATTFLEYAA